MNELGDGNNVDEDVDDEVETDDDATVVMADDEATVVMADDDDDDAIEMTGEVNVDALVAKIDATPKDDAEKQRQIRQRLDRLHDERDNELDSTYNFNLDDEL